jgi:hypothetical protein
MTLQTSIAHNAARLMGSVAFADTGAGQSRMRFYATARPALGADPGGPALAEVVLAKPCGSVANGVLTLAQQDASGDLVLVTGAPVWARWINGEGALVADGDVSDDAGSGDFKIGGTAAGGILYAGARLRLGACTLA